MRPILIGFLSLSLLTITGCEESGDPIHPQVVTAELYALGDDFRLWDLMQEQGIDNGAIKTRVANLMIGRFWPKAAPGLINYWMTATDPKWILSNFSITPSSRHSSGRHPLY